MKKILIPIDGSENSKKALIEGKRLAEVFGSKIVLMYVERTSKLRGPYADLYMSVAMEHLENVGKQIISDGLQVLNNPSDLVETKIELGDAAEEIIRVAEEEDIDLIVMGSRGLSGIKKFVLGSVSTKVLNHAHCSVFIIR